MWGPLLEKAWAKVKGSYSNSEHGFAANGIRALTGAPVFSYYTKNMKTSTEIDAAFFSLKEAALGNYIMAAAVGGVHNSQVNDCGIYKAHAYAILTAFDLTVAG